VAGVWRGCGGGVAGVWRGCGGGVAGVWRGCGGGVRGYQGVYRVYFVSETDQVELNSGRV